MELISWRVIITIGAFSIPLFLDFSYETYGLVLVHDKRLLHEVTNHLQLVLALSNAHDKALRVCVIDLRMKGITKLTTHCLLLQVKLARCHLDYVIAIYRSLIIGYG